MPGKRVERGGDKKVPGRLVPISGNYCIVSSKFNIKNR